MAKTVLLFCWKGFTNLNPQIRGYAFNIVDGAQWVVIANSEGNLAEWMKEDTSILSISAADFTPDPKTIYFFALAPDEDVNVEEEAIIREKLLASGVKFHQFRLMVAPGRDQFVHYFDMRTWRWTPHFMTSTDGWCQVTAPTKD